MSRAQTSFVFGSCNKFPFNSVMEVKDLITRSPVSLAGHIAGQLRYNFNRTVNLFSMKKPICLASNYNCWLLHTLSTRLDVELHKKSWSISYILPVYEKIFWNKKKLILELNVRLFIIQRVSYAFFLSFYWIQSQILKHKRFSTLS